MKPNSQTKVLTLLVLFLIVLDINAKKSYHRRSHSHKQSFDKLVSESVAVSKRKAVAHEKGSKADKINKFIDGLGLKMKKNSVLTQFPYKVTSCDQIMIFKAKYITDLGDYRLRADGWFSMTAYRVNLFKDKDAKQLIHSVLWTKTKKNTDHLPGAKGCISIDGGSVTADITICYSSKAKVKNILENVRRFERCRAGDNLTKIPLDILRKLIQLCGQGKTRYASKGYIKNYKLNLKLRAGNKWDYDRQRFFHGGQITVPGTK